MCNIMYLHYYYFIINRVLYVYIDMSCTLRIYTNVICVKQDVRE